MSDPRTDRDAAGGDFGVVLAAAGSGRRFGAKKQFLELGGRPLLHLSLDVFCGLSGVREVVVVAPREDLTTVDAMIDAWPREAGGPAIFSVAGGERRQDSVKNGIERLSEKVEFVLVHDAARPLLAPDDASRVMDAVRSVGAAALGHPATDSIKEARDGKVRRGLARETIWQVQTPQGARRSLLLQAYEAVTAVETLTDEVGLLEKIGVEVALVEGRRDNIKVTAPGDEELATFLLGRRKRRPR